jgi:hypothetical protein
MQQSFSALGVSAQVARALERRGMPKPSGRRLGGRSIVVEEVFLWQPEP